MTPPAATATPTKSSQTSRRPPASRRRPSPATAQALDGFAHLREFFARDTGLTSALGWDDATVAQWRDRRVGRVRRAKAAEVLLLLAVCEEAHAYLQHPHQVGEWALAPQPHLRGSTPAKWVRERGARGLQELTAWMLDAMPTRPLDTSPVDVSKVSSVQELRRQAEDDPDLAAFVDAL